MVSFKLFPLTAFGIMLAVQGALADVTPDQVWENFQVASNAMGYKIIAGSTVHEGNDLIAKDIEIIAQYPQDSALFKANAGLFLDSALFKDNQDGTVSISVSEKIRFKSDVTFDRDLMPQAGDMKMDSHFSADMQQTGLDIMVSGAFHAMDYDYRLEKLSFHPVDDKITDMMITIGGDLTGLKGKFISVYDAQSKVLAFETDNKADLFKYDIGMKAPDQTSMKYHIDLSGLFFKRDGKIVGSLGDPLQAFRAGTFVNDHGGYGLAKMNGSLADKNITLSDFFTYMDQGVDYRVAVIDGKATGRMAVQNGVFHVATPPHLNLQNLGGGFREIRFDMAVPLLKSDKPVSAALSFKYDGIYLNEEVWALFDAGQKFSRDPIDFALDLNVTGILNVDLFDQKAMFKKMQGEKGGFGRLDHMVLNDFTLSGAGVKATAKGELNFDHQDVLTFKGMPAPMGEATFKIVGINGFINKLMEMGVLPADQAMAVRVMMGAAFKAVSGEEDALSSDIEFKNKGLFVNGLKIR